MKGIFGELCYDDFPCANGFACTLPNRLCGRASRVLGEICDPAQTAPDQCAATGYACSALWPYCMPPASVAASAARVTRAGRRLSGAP